MTHAYIIDVFVISVNRSWSIFFMIYNLKRKKNRVIKNYAWQTFFIIIDNELTINTNYGKCKGLEFTKRVHLNFVNIFVYIHSVKF